MYHTYRTQRRTDDRPKPSSLDKRRAKSGATSASDASEPAVTKYDIHRTREIVSAVVGGMLDTGDNDSAPVAGDFDGDGRYSDPILQLVRRLPGYGLAHEVQLLTLHLMRKYSPTLDNTIGLCRRLEGDLVIHSEDEGLERALTDWARQVPVGYIASEVAMTGLDTYLDMLADGADEYGMGVGEMLLTPEGNDVARLVTPNMRTIQLADRDADGLWEMYQRQTDRVTADSVQPEERGTGRIDNRRTVQTLVFRPSAEDPWPYPLAWSAMQSTEAVMRMYHSVLNGWWRHGDPSLLNKIEFDADSSTDMTTLPGAAPDGGDLQVPTALFVLSDRLKDVMEARRKGQVRDANVYVDGGSLASETLGDVDATLLKYFRDHASVFDGHVVSAAPLPAFLFPHIEAGGDGLGSTRSQSMASIAATATDRRNARKLTLAKQVLDTHLTLQGDSRFVGQYSLDTQAVDIMDDKLRAEAEQVQADADASRVVTASQLFNPDGSRRFQGDAERYLEEHGLYPSDNPNA